MPSLRQATIRLAHSQPKGSKLRTDLIKVLADHNPDGEKKCAGWMTPRRNQGQIVEVSYTSGEGGIYKRVLDRSDHSEEFYFAPWDAVRGEFEPWNDVPSVPERAWKKVRRPMLASAREAELRAATIRLAHNNPELRPHLLPLLK